MIEGGISCISQAKVARWREALGRVPTEARVERWVRTQLLHRRSAVRIHPGVSLVLKHLREKLGVSNDFSPEDPGWAFWPVAIAFHARFQRIDGESLSGRIFSGCVCNRPVAT
jgi:hypothetical protein